MRRCCSEAIFQTEFIKTAVAKKKKKKKQGVLNNLLLHVFIFRYPFDWFPNPSGNPDLWWISVQDKSQLTETWDQRSCDAIFKTNSFNWTSKTSIVLKLLGESVRVQFVINKLHGIGWLHRLVYLSLPDPAWLYRRHFWYWYQHNPIMMRLFFVLNYYMFMLAAKTFTEIV